MSTLRSILLLLLCLANMAVGGTVTLLWGAVSGADSYWVYRGIERVRSTASPSATIEIPDGQDSSFTVTAVNRAGESGHSAPVSFSPRPVPVPEPEAKPGPRVIVEFSDDLTTWGERFLPSSRFARARIETP